MTFILLIAKMKNKKKEDIHMGAYAGYQGKKGINERDQIAFSRQMVKILNYGGMMSFDVVYVLLFPTSRRMGGIFNQYGYFTEPLCGVGISLYERFHDSLSDLSQFILRWEGGSILISIMV
jgi:hypothetical protein